MKEENNIRKPLDTVEENGVSIAKPAVEAFKPYDAIVNTPALKLHKEADHNSEVVRIVRGGSVLKVISEKNGYCNVGDAWASKKFLKRK